MKPSIPGGVGPSLGVTVEQKTIKIFVSKRDYESLRGQTPARKWARL